DRGIANPERLRAVLDLAAAADKDLNELQLLAGQPRQASEGEVAVQRGATGGALESDDAQIVAAHRTAGEDLMRGRGVASPGRRVPAIEIGRHIEKINARLDICQHALDYVAVAVSGRPARPPRPGTRTPQAAPRTPGRCASQSPAPAPRAP